MPKKKVIMSVLVAAIVALWFWRYVSVNEYYASMDNSSIRYFDMYEKVPFGSDYIEWEEQANGYYICVDKFEILDYDGYLESAPFQIDPMLDSDKIALVYITLYNENNVDSGIFLSDFCLHGIDSIQGMDWQVLTAANPILGEGHGIRLQQGSQQQFVLPFYLRCDSFGADTWANLKNYDFFLRVTAFPTQKDIRLSVTNFES